MQSKMNEGHEVRSLVLNISARDHFLLISLLCLKKALDCGLKQGSKMRSVLKQIKNLSFLLLLIIIRSPRVLRRKLSRVVPSME